MRANTDVGVDSGRRVGSGAPRRTRRAPADERPPIGLAAGTATAIVPLIVGGALMAQDHSPQLQETGLIVMASGFALAPFVAHGLEGSWRRAAIYGGISLALSAAAVAEMERSNAFDPHVGNDRRIPMKIFLPLAMASSGVGVIMSVFDRRGLETQRRGCHSGWRRRRAGSRPGSGGARRFEAPPRDDTRAAGAHWRARSAGAAARWCRRIGASTSAIR